MAYKMSIWDDEPESVFTRMSRMANAHEAINLAQGFPDFDGPDIIKKQAIDSITKGPNQYAPTAGLVNLRKAIAKHYEKQHQFKYDAEREITVFSGATEALFCAIQALGGPGKEFVAFEPFYDSYLGSVKASYSQLVGIPLDTKGWTFDATALENAISDKTVAMIVNTPHNPTGKVFKRSELDIIASLCIKHNLIAIVDEVYENLTFEDAKHVRVAGLKNMRERTITISSTSKNFSMTGWKVGYSFAPNHLSKILRAVHQYTVFCSATPLQNGLSCAFELGEEYYDTFRSEYLERRNLLVDVLNKCGFKLVAPLGTYFVVADYSDIKDIEDEEFCEELIKQHGVAAIPLSPFFVDTESAKKRLRMVRFGFCKDIETIKEGGRRLISAFGTQSIEFRKSREDTPNLPL